MKKVKELGLYRRDPAFIMTLLMTLASFSCEVSTCFFSLSSSSFCVADFARLAKSKRGFESSAENKVKINNQTFDIIKLYIQFFLVTEISN